MLLIYLVGQLLALSLYAASDDIEEPIVLPIVGGYNSEHLPWFVSVYAEGGLCGGSAISHYAVLTAAHCFHNFTSLKNMYVYYGKGQLTQRKRTEIRTVFIHPQYHQDIDRFQHNDIAVVFGKQPIGDIVSWLWHHPCPNTSVWVAGFGSTQFVNASYPLTTKPTASHYLKKTRVKVIKEETCSKLAEREIGSNVFCTLASGTSSCFGDSGGPVYGFDRRNNYVLYGVISIARGCGDDSHPHLHTRIWPFQRWIYETLLWKSKLIGIWRGS